MPPKFETIPQELRDEIFKETGTTTVNLKRQFKNSDDEAYDATERQRHAMSFRMTHSGTLERPRTNVLSVSKSVRGQYTNMLRLSKGVSPKSKEEINHNMTLTVFDDLSGDTSNPKFANLDALSAQIKKLDVNLIIWDYARAGGYSCAERQGRCDTSQAPCVIKQELRYHSGALMLLLPKFKALEQLRLKVKILGGIADSGHEEVVRQDMRHIMNVPEVPHKIKSIDVYQYARLEGNMNSMEELNFKWEAEKLVLGWTREAGWEQWNRKTFEKKNITLPTTNSTIRE